MIDMPRDVMADDELMENRLTALRELNMEFGRFVENPSAERWGNLEQTMMNYQQLVKNTIKQSTADRANEDFDAKLETNLRQMRRKAAENLNWPPYRVFTETALRGLLQAKPTTKAELKQVTGFGPKKVAHFGEDILKVINETLA